MTRVIAPLRADQSGASLIEFAIVLPVLVLLYVGSYQLTDALSAYRKITSTARTLADLTTKTTEVSEADINDIFTASRQVLSPYSSTPAVLKITQITTNATGQSTVDWSRAYQGTAYAAGTSVALPAAIKQNGASIVMSEISYRYTPGTLPSLVGTIPLGDKIYMSPRRSAQIAIKQ